MLAQAPEFVGPEVRWFSLAPMLTLLAGTLVLMVGSALVRRKLLRGSFAFVTVFTAATAFVFACFLWDDVRDSGPTDLVGRAIALDGFSLFVTMAICAAVALVALLSDDYLRREGLEDAEGVEFNALLMLAATGGIVMSCANDLVVLFLGLETLSLALYVLAAAHLKRNDSQESAVKYFVLGGFSSAFFLYGVALVYGATGSTNLADIVEFLQRNVLLEESLLLAGIALMLVGLAFKVAAAPFHIWTPDVYQGAPTPATAFMASAAKAAGFAAMLRVLYVGFDAYADDWRPVLWVLAILTLVVGSVLALVQTNVKRMLAYSSISHAGFMLVAVQQATARGTSAVLFYVMAYTFMVAGTFGIVTLVGRTGDANHDLDSFRGLARRRPALALAFAILLFAQAGVPPSSGFMAKFYVIAAAADRESWVLAVVAMLSAVVAAYLYLRIIVSMYLSEPSEADAATPLSVPLSAGLAIGIAVAFTLAVGLVPSPLIDMARDATPQLIASPGL
jgi:NADH-quinone oxidoreductase subunit N